MKVIATSIVHALQRYGGTNTFFNGVLPRFARSPDTRVDRFLPRDQPGVSPGCPLRTIPRDFLLSRPGLSWSLDNTREPVQESLKRKLFGKRRRPCLYFTRLRSPTRSLRNPRGSGRIWRETTAVTLGASPPGKREKWARGRVEEVQTMSGARHQHRVAVSAHGSARPCGCRALACTRARRRRGPSARISRIAATSARGGERQACPARAAPAGACVAAASRAAERRSGPRRRDHHRLGPT